MSAAEYRRRLRELFMAAIADDLEALKNNQSESKAGRPLTLEPKGGVSHGMRS